LDESYAYIGHMFDKLKETDPLADYAALGALALFCADDAAEGFIIGQLSVQFAAWGDVVVVRSADPGAFAITIDDDWDIGQADGTEGPTFDPPAVAGQGFIGNGNTNTLFRFREGIERYLITDINNPGASNVGQTQVMVVFDQGSTLAAGFNHIPGGSNVLFLDGHVEFEKYPGRPPVAPNVMWVTHCIQTGT
jgi:prepilin-type processing-associated H-X9-DG protein